MPELPISSVNRIHFNVASKKDAPKQGLAAPVAEVEHGGVDAVRTRGRKRLVRVVVVELDVLQVASKPRQELDPVSLAPF
jgi:hypothetical protein